MDPDDQFIATFRPRRQLTDHEQHACRRALPRIRQWAAENKGKYSTPEAAADACKCVVVGFLAAVFLLIAEEIVADLCLEWIRKHWST